MGTQFISGVVEGFYGRPWNLEQRFDLFARLQTLSLSSYMYAPKDDIKHRLKWRELYTDEEADSLRQLIDAANKHDVTFIYALSPGIDIRYSDHHDVAQIKAKLEQVRSLGCTAFALLFDDIEQEMKADDKEVFDSFAQAQVHVTNKTYEAMGHALFFFCPTEYCESRANPTLEDSEYLNTLGSTLHTDIHIMWTGPKVVPRYLTVEHCQRVGRVLRRKPFIWDNLHANDYDMRRLYLGPFSGRSVYLKDHISGLLLNPNNKYEANFIPIHTMSDWLRATSDFNPDAMIEEEIADEKNLDVYDPRTALARAVDSWLTVFATNTGATGDAPPMAPVRDETSNQNMVCSVLPSSSDATFMDVEEDLMQIAAPRPLPVAAVDEMVRSAVTITTLPDNPESIAVNSLVPEYAESTELAAPVIPMRSREEEEDGEEDTNPSMDSTFDTLATEENSLENTSAPVESLNRDKLELLIDFFHLPFDYGKSAITVLHNYEWILINTPLYNDAPWPDFAACLSDLRKIIIDYDKFFNCFMECTNRHFVQSLMSELLPFVWEVHGMLAVVNGMVSWIEQGNLYGSTNVCPRVWSSELFQGEPWAHNNPVQGFISDIANSIANSKETAELLINRNLLPLSVICFQIRPLQRDDAVLLYHLMKKSHSQKWKEPHTEMSLKVSKTYDRFFGMYNLNGFSKYAFLAEDTSTQTALCAVVGCMALSDMHVRIFPAFVEETVQLYVGDDEISDETRTDIRVEVESWKPRGVTSDITEKYPSQVHIYAACDIADAIPTKRLVQTIASALSYNGSIGLHTFADSEDTVKITFLNKLGFEFIKVAPNGDAVFGLKLSTPDPDAIAED